MLDRILILVDHLDDCHRPIEPHHSYAWQRNRERAEIEALRASLARV